MLYLHLNNIPGTGQRPLEVGQLNDGTPQSYDSGQKQGADPVQLNKLMPVSMAMIIIAAVKTKVSLCRCQDHLSTCAIIVGAAI